MIIYSLFLKAYGVHHINAICFRHITFFLLMLTSRAMSADYFDPSLLSLGRDIEDIDLSQFEKKGGIAVGDYLVTIFVNQQNAGTYSVKFSKNGQGEVFPELTPNFLEKMGINIQGVPAFKNLPLNEPVENIAILIPSSSVHIDLPRLRLDLSIPQIAMQPNIQGQVNSELWEDGIPALVANYSLSAGRSERTVNSNKSYTNNLFAVVNAGANVGAWRLRSTINHTYSHSGGLDSNSRDQTRFSNTQIFRDLRDFRSTLLVGQDSTGSDVFDGIPFRGVKLNSNEQMLPSQLRGYAPVVSGIASSNARVTIRQNGNVVYETYVAPGPFEIRDIYQAGMSGDLDVTINEVDGSVRSFIVPFSSLPVMLRPGSFKYEITAGRYDSGSMSLTRKADFLFTTLVYGLPKDITLYGGSLIANDYISASFGSGLSFGNIGAVSADITSSKAKFAGESRESGKSYRLRYSKSMISTGTSVDLTALRYSTKQYYSFNDFNDSYYQQSSSGESWRLNRRRSSFQTQISQQLGEYGSLTLRANQDNYWGTEKRSTGLSAGYSGSSHGVSYALYYTIDRVKSDYNWPENRQIAFNMNIPFSLFGSSPILLNTYASSQMTHDNHGQTQNQIGITGTGGEGAFNYGVMQSWGNRGQESNSTLNVGYLGSKGAVNVGYGYSQSGRSMNLNMSGGMVVHSGGVTLSRSLGSSMALISAPGANGVSTSSGAAKTDGFGYAVVPYLSDYSKNSIGLDPSTLPQNVELVKSNINVYPTRGAVVKANFTTRIGYQVLMTLQKNSGVIPFGASAYLIGDEDTDNSAIVGDRGQVYLTGLPEKGTLLISWGKGSDKECRVNFNLSGLKPTTQMPIIQKNETCF